MCNAEVSVRACPDTKFAIIALASMSISNHEVSVAIGRVKAYSFSLAMRHAMAKLVYGLARVLKKA